MRGTPLSLIGVMRPLVLCTAGIVFGVSALWALTPDAPQRTALERVHEASGDTFPTPSLKEVPDEVPLGRAYGVYRLYLDADTSEGRWQSGAVWYHNWGPGDDTPPTFWFMDQGSFSSQMLTLRNWDESYGVGEHPLSPDGLHVDARVESEDRGLLRFVVDQGVFIVEEVVDHEYPGSPSYVGMLRGSGRFRGQVAGYSEEEVTEEQGIGLVIRFHSRYEPAG